MHQNLVKERQTTDHLIAGKSWSRDKENMNEKHATAGSAVLGLSFMLIHCHVS